MLFARHCIDLVLEHSQGLNHARARFARFDDIIDEALLGGDEGVFKAVLIFRDLLAEQLLAVKSLGCDLGQGFLLARPASEDVVGGLLAMGGSLVTAHVRAVHMAPRLATG